MNYICRVQAYQGINAVFSFDNVPEVDSSSKLFHDARAQTMVCSHETHHSSD